MVEDCASEVLYKIWCPLRQLVPSAQCVMYIMGAAALLANNESSYICLCEN